MSQVKIKELRLRNYRAFSDARLVLDDITFLVGRNGAGKSTLMDAMSFMSEAVTDSLSTALERRGNLEGVRRWQPGKGPKYDVWIAVVLSLGASPVVYGFRLGSDATRSSYLVKHESLSGISHWFTRDRQSITSNRDGIRPVPDPESLVFPLIAGTSPFWKAIYEGLRSISVHQFSPQAIRSEPKIGSEERLNRDGSNAGDVLKHTRPKDRNWIEEHLKAAIPGIRGVRATARVGRRVIVFEQEGGNGQSCHFDASTMSDGAVRSLGILLSLRQTPRPSIVLLDEIEDSLHPDAHGVLLDAINSARRIPRGHLDAQPGDPEPPHGNGEAHSDRPMGRRDEPNLSHEQSSPGESEVSTDRRPPPPLERPLDPSLALDDGGGSRFLQG